MATRIVLVEVVVGKNQEKMGFFKKYIKAISSVLMDKVIYNKFKIFFKVDKNIDSVKICLFYGKVVKNQV